MQGAREVCEAEGGIEQKKERVGVKGQERS